MVDWEVGGGKGEVLVMRAMVEKIVVGAATRELGRGMNEIVSKNGIN